MSEQDINKELEEILDAELTEEEVLAMETETQTDLEEAEEIGGVVKFKTASAKAKALKAGGGDKSELSDDSEDLGDAVTSPDDKDSHAGKAADKAKKAKPTNSAGSEAKVSQGNSGQAHPGQTQKLAAGDEIDHEGETLEEGRMTKAKMLEDLKASIEGLDKLKAGDLKGIHEKINAAIKGDTELEEETESEKELKELKAQKKEIEERMKKISVKEDVEALVKGEELSDEFKEKATTIFEAAVKSKIRTEIERLEEEYAEKISGEVSKTVDATTERVDNYLSYVVEEWMKDNEVAIEHKLKTEITESFITGLHGLFDEHNITVPDEKYDILDAAAKQADEMEAKLNEQLEKNVEMSRKVADLEKSEILVDVASDLADTEVEKFVGLAEGVEYEDSDDYRKKLETVKESYFGASTPKTTDEVDAAPIYNVNGDMSNQMAAYMSAIARQEKRAPSTPSAPLQK